MMEFTAPMAGLIVALLVAAGGAWWKALHWALEVKIEGLQGRLELAKERNEEQKRVIEELRQSLSSDRKYSAQEMIEHERDIAGKLQLVESGNKAVGKALGAGLHMRPEPARFSTKSISDNNDVVESVSCWAAASIRSATEKNPPSWVRPEED